MSLYSSVKDGLRKGMDLSASRILRELLQDRMARYGVLKELSLDSGAKQFRVRIELKGELEATEVVAERYEVVKEGGEVFLVIREVKASKEWMTELLKDFLVDQRFLLPSKYAGIIGKLL